MLLSRSRPSCQPPSQVPKRETDINPSRRESRRPATADDVARLAGVSQSAVSRAFTEGASVSKIMRGKVLEAAQSLGYRPNLIARSLITRRSNIVGVAIGYLENQFYPEALRALSARLGEQGYRILLFSVDQAGDADPGLEEVLRYQVDALVMASVFLSSHLAEECRQAGVPVVLINRKTDDTDVSSVTGDNWHGSQTLAAFLAAGGHRRFAFVAGLENASTSRDREAGYTNWLIQNGFGPPARAVGRYSFDGAMQAARQLFSQAARPEAVFAANDHMALAVIEVARNEFGLEIGKDVSVVGFDDVGPAGWPSFGLTTFSQPIKPMVDEVVRIIEMMVEDPSSETVQHIVPGELVVRTSARLPSTGLTQRDGLRIWTPPQVPNKS